MYNGVDLLFARGSGSHGYTQTNKFFVKPKKIAAKSNGGAAIKGAGGAGVSEKMRREILEHDRKSHIELKLIVLEHTLIDHGYTEDEIVERLAEARRNFKVASLAVSKNKGISSRFLSF